MILVIACLICGILSFPVSTFQYLHATPIFIKFGKSVTYRELMKVSRGFLYVGLANVIVTIGAFLAMYFKGSNIIHPTTDVEICLMGATFGGGVNGIANFSFYTFKNGNNSISLGTKILLDPVHNIVGPSIPEDYSIFLNDLTIEAEKNPPFQGMTKQQLVDHLSRYITFGEDIDKKAFIIDATKSSNNLAILRLFIMKFGLKHFRAAQR